MGDVLNCKRESGNPNDSYAIAIKNGASVIGHIPRKLSAACSLFLSLGEIVLPSRNLPDVDFSALLSCLLAASTPVLKVQTFQYYP